MATNSAKVYRELEIEPIGVQGHDSAQSRIAPWRASCPISSQSLPTASAVVWHGFMRCASI